MKCVKKMKYAKKIKSENGFSLIEVIIAISILAVGILATASMQIGSIQGNSTARGLSEATTLAGDEIEYLVTLRWNHSDLTDTDGDGTSQDADGDGVDDDGGNFGLEDDPAAGADHQVAQGRYTIYWNVANEQVIADTKTINLVVIWREGLAPKRVIMQRIIPKIT